jgi:glycosyltransferase involved in cell wall biosynthesis
MASPHYSIVVPVYDEEEVLPEFYERLRAVVDGLAHPAEIIFVDDGSLDRSLTFLRELPANHNGVRVLSLSRNFGHQAALTAGLAHAAGEAVAVVDADLQDPPELLAELFRLVEEGWDVAYGIRTERKEGIGKRLAYFVFYRLLRRMADIDIPLDSGDFCAMSRRVVDRLNALPESDRFIRGLRAWLGFRQTGVPYERDRRHAGAPKYTVEKLLRLSLDGMFSFSDAPLRLIGLLGVAVSSVSFLGILVVLYRYVFTPYVPGYTSLAVLVLFIGGIQLLTLGVIGEYIGRISKQVKSRPHYVVNERIGFEQR